MIMFDFDKTRARELLDCLDNVRAIPAPREGWTQCDLLRLAGAYFFAAMSLDQ